MSAAEEIVLELQPIAINEIKIQKQKCECCDCGYEKIKEDKIRVNMIKCTLCFMMSYRHRSRSDPPKVSSPSVAYT